MQSKINSFFRPSSSSSATSIPSTVSSSKPAEVPPLLSQEDDELTIWERTQNVIINTYKRRSAKSDGNRAQKEPMSNTAKKPASVDSSSKKESAAISKNLNKKRSFAQFHLELGQSDFLLRSCSMCGVKYAPGDEFDEKNHNTFHKNYTHGIRFKGWRSERVVHGPCTNDDRIVMVLDNDPPAHRNKIQEVVNMMEIELGEDWILCKHCKVYLFVSSQRIVGCLVAQPIKKAFKLLACFEDKTCKSLASIKKTVSQPTTIRFGNAVLRREIQQKSRPLDFAYHSGTVMCEDEASPAVCGIRAIWVTPSNRRRGIATRLLDAMRESFCEGIVLDKSQLAFSQPSSHGKAFASGFFGTAAFLVYKADDSFC